MTADNALPRFVGAGGIIESTNSYVSDNGSIFARGESDTEVQIGTMGYGVTSVFHNFTAGGTIASPTAPASGSLIGGYGSRPFQGGGVFSEHSTAAIHFIANENIGPNNHGTTFRILVTPTGVDQTQRITAIQFMSPSPSDGPRFQGDFSNATHKLRAAFQTNTVNGNTSVGIIPNGTSTIGQLNTFNKSIVTDSSYTAIKTDSFSSQILSGKIGAGTSLPLRLVVDNSVIASEFGTDGNLNRLMVPTAQARKITSGQTLSDAIYAAITFNDEVYDTDGIHNTSNNSSRFVAPVAGKYRVSATINYGPSAAGVRIINFRINGSTTERYGSALIPANTINNAISSSTELNLAAGDYVELFAYQNSGGNLDVTAEGVVGTCRMTMTYIGV